MASLSFGGGLNELDDFNISVEECISGHNFLLNKTSKSFRPRPPQDLKGTATNASDIRGIMQLIKKDNTETTLVQSGATVYSWDGASSFTDKGTVNATSKLRDTTWQLDDLLIVTDISKLTVLKRWDGTTLKNLQTTIGNGVLKSVSSITRVGTTATATSTAHGFVNGDYLTVSGADQAGYNGVCEISNVTTNTFDATVDAATATPATGTIVAEKDDTVFAKYSIVKDGRVWLFNTTIGSTSTPHMLLASKFEDAENYDSSERAVDGTFATGNEAFFIFTKDLKAINGVALFQDQLLISTEDGRLYKLTGNDANDYAFVDFYGGSAATGTETMINIGNDILYMKNGGNIDSLQSTEKFGDVSADDASRWIPTSTDSLTDAIAVYDQQRQRAVFFVTNKVLVMDKETWLVTDVSPWMSWTTKMTNNFTTNAAKYLRVPGSSTYSVYWGDSAGKIYDMNGVGASGDAGSSDVEVVRKSRLIGEGDFINDILHGRVEYRRIGVMDLTMDFEWSDHYSITSCLVPLKAAAVIGSTSFFGGEVFFNSTGSNARFFNGGDVSSTRVSTAGWSAAGKGESFFLTLTADTSVNFLVNRIHESVRI